MVRTCPLERLAMDISYTLVNRKRGKAITFEHAYSVACFLLGKMISEWTVLKFDGPTAKVVPITTNEVTAIEKEIENG